MTNDELDQWVEDLLANNGREEQDWYNALEQALEGNRRLRDDNFVEPNAILVFTEATDTLEEVAFAELPLRFPLLGKGTRWSYNDLGEILAVKALLYRQSMIAQEISDEDPTAEPLCGTVVLVQRTNRHCLSWHKVQARIDPALN
jgi:hypothetical protein